MAEQHTARFALGEFVKFNPALYPESRGAALRIVAVQFDEGKTEPAYGFVRADGSGGGHVPESSLMGLTETESEGNEDGEEESES